MTVEQRDQRRHDRAQLILRTIREVRAEHHACTAREVSRRTKTTHTLVVQQLDNLRKAGMVEWTEMPGSLRLTLKGGKFSPRSEG